jgi:hypothetical protein
LRDPDAVPVRRSQVADLVVIVGVVAFLAVCLAYVVGCDRIIGPDGADQAEGDPERVDLPAVPGTR